MDILRDSQRKCSETIFSLDFKNNSEKFYQDLVSSPGATPILLGGGIVSMFDFLIDSRSIKATMTSECSSSCSIDVSAFSICSIGPNQVGYSKHSNVCSVKVPPKANICAITCKLISSRSNVL